MISPDIYDFVDYKPFMEAWLKWKKASMPRFSHRGFVRRVGQKSPSLLVDLVAGRRALTSAMVAPFAKAMDLDAERRRYLGLLVEMDRAKTPDERNLVWEKIMAKRRFHSAHAIEGESFRYLSDWTYPAIRELAARSDFRPDPRWIAQTLRPKVTEARARDALDALFELGMLIRGDDGTVEQADGSVVTPREVLGLAVHNYHQGMIDRARDGIVDFRQAERHYTGLTVCIPEALVPRIKDEINQFAERLLMLCDDSETPAERVYQLHMMAFPLSASVEEDV